MNELKPKDSNDCYIYWFPSCDMSIFTILFRRLFLMLPHLFFVKQLNSRFHDNFKIQPRRQLRSMKIIYLLTDSSANPIGCRVLVNGRGVNENRLSARAYSSPVFSLSLSIRLEDFGCTQAGGKAETVFFLQVSLMHFLQSFSLFKR